MENTQKLDLNLGASNKIVALLDLIVVFTAIAGCYILELALRDWGIVSLPEYTKGLGGVAGGVLAVIILKIVRGQRWSDYGFRRPKRIWMVPVWVIAIIFTYFVAQNGSVALISQFVEVPGPNLARYDFLYQNLSGLLLLSSVIWLTASLPEELIYRGFVFDRLTQIFGTGVTGTLIIVFLQAAFFGAIHFHAGITGVLMTFIMGLVWGAMYLVTGRNLWPLIIAHYFADVIGLTLLFFVQGSTVGAG